MRAKSEPIDPRRAAKYSPLSRQEVVRRRTGHLARLELYWGVRDGRTLDGYRENLEGVRRVLELEAEVAKLRSELDEVRAAAKTAVADTHRQYRRDLVPLRQSPVPYRRR